MYVLFGDTDCDLTLKEAAEFGFNIISMPYSIGDTEIKPYIDFKEFDFHEFYNKLRSGTLPKTSGLSPETYVNYFEPFFKEGKDILYVHFTAAMSSTFDSMKIALDELKEKYPERKFYSLDTCGITAISYNIYLEVGKMYKNGCSAEEIMEWGEREVQHYAIYFFAEDLTFFRRSGRVSNMTAFFGNIMNIHPIMTITSEGRIISIDKAVGKNTTLKKIMSYVDAYQLDIQKHRIVIGHSDALATAKQLGGLITEKYGECDIVYVDINPTSGSHCGPDAIGICFYATKRQI